MNKRFILSLTAILFLMRLTLFSQELPRSAWFGAQVSELTDSAAAALKLSSRSGTLIKLVVPSSSAQKAGFIVNDVLVSINDERIENTGHFLTLLKNYHGGDKVKIGFYRNSKLKSISIELLPKKLETNSEIDIIYSSVKSGSNHLRSIIAKPKSGTNFPAVLLIGGVGCYSIDNPSSKEIMSIKMWADSLARIGYVTIRVEKTGMGDSKGIPCKESDFLTEKQGFLEGLRQLKTLPYVDKENVFIAGFSIGGVIAPLIAQQEPVKGIIVYGTVGRNWLEYELENASRQQELENRSADSIDLYMRGEYQRLYGLFVEKKQPHEIMKAHPEATPNFFEYPMRIEYFQQVADVNIREHWMKTNAKVLAMHGSTDFVSSAAEHKLLAETVNRYHPGNATYIEIPSADHWSLLAESEMISYSHQQTELNALPLAKAIEWLSNIR